MTLGQETRREARVTAEHVMHDALAIDRRAERATRVAIGEWTAIRPKENVDEVRARARHDAEAALCERGKKRGRNPGGRDVRLAADEAQRARVLVVHGANAERVRRFRQRGGVGRFEIDLARARRAHAIRTEAVELAVRSMARFALRPRAKSELRDP